MASYEPFEPIPTKLPVGTPSPLAHNPRWNALRACWLDLEDPRLRSFKDTDFSKDLRRRHVEALDALVAGRELDAAVADKIKAAFNQAIAHIQRQMATCYAIATIEYMPREDLMKQAAALTEMAGQSNIDPATVAQAQAGLERDLTWLAQFDAEQKRSDPETIEATPEASEAARILVEVLLGKK